MDITGLTIAQRMRFPEWCYGEKTVVAAYGASSVPGADVFAISSIALPDPACIWKAQFFNMSNAGSQSWMRFGLRATIPTNPGEMDGATEIFPDFGNPAAGPNTIIFYNDGLTYFSIDAAMGMATAGQYLVTQVHCTAGNVRLQVSLVVTGLPTDLAGWLSHNIV